MTKVRGSYWSFIKKNRKYHFWGALIAFLLVLIFIFLTNGQIDKLNKVALDNDLTWWTDWVDPLIGFGVFIVAVIIGIVQLLEDWEDSLDKRLTVYFKEKDRDVMICHKAFLSDVADIRNLGQQIGGQMATIRFLDFEANNIQNEKLGIEKYNNEFIVHHQVIFQFTKLPEPDNRSTEKDKIWIEKLKTNTLIWHEPETKEGMKWINLPKNDSKTKD